MICGRGAVRVGSEGIVIGVKEGGRNESWLPCMGVPGVDIVVVVAGGRTCEVAGVL